MSNKTYTLGFVGIESYDIIHYISRVLCKMNKNVILIDCTDSLALKSSIPIPAELEDTNIITYRDVDFSITYKSDMIENYDYIIFDFGWNLHNSYIKDCNQIFFVSDLQIHNGLRLRNAFKTQNENVAKIILRNVIKSKIKPEFVIRILDANLLEGQYYVIYEDTTDKEYMLSCQYDNVFNFRRLSVAFKDTLHQILVDQLKLDQIEVKKAFKLAEKGV